MFAYLNLRSLLIISGVDVKKEICISIPVRNALDSNVIYLRAPNDKFSKYMFENSLLGIDLIGNLPK